MKNVIKPIAIYATATTEGKPDFLNMNIEAVTDPARIMSRRASIQGLRRTSESLPRAIHVPGSMPGYPQSSLCSSGTEQGFSRNEVRMKFPTLNTIKLYNGDIELERRKKRFKKTTHFD